MIIDTQHRQNTEWMYTGVKQKEIEHSLYQVEHYFASDFNSKLQPIPLEEGVPKYHVFSMSLKKFSGNGLHLRKVLILCIMGWRALNKVFGLALSEFLLVPTVTATVT